MNWQDIHAIAFDLDGTLVDSLADLAAAANAMRHQLKLPPLPAAEVQSYVGDGISVLVHRTLSGRHDGQVDAEQWQAGLTAFINDYHRHLAVHTRPYPEVESALKLFRHEQRPLAVVTNKNEVLAAALLQQLGLADYFSLIIGGDTLPQKKPAALPLQHTAAVLGVDCGHLLMVGDSANDILAAKAAGCPSVGVRWGYADMDALAQDAATRPDLIIDSLPQIYDRLRPSEP